MGFPRGGRFRVFVFGGLFEGWVLKGGCLEGGSVAM